MTSREPRLSTGTRVGRYEVESFLGAGGMGEVYIARDTNLGRLVALKILPADCGDERIARFQREAQASSSLNHPAIVSVHDAGCADGVNFLAMELIEGESLASWIASRRNVKRGVLLLAQVADGLARAHASGIVHRDLKPDNIMVGRDGYAKIVDFGIAKLKDRDTGVDAATEVKTATGSLIGTASYMSPEQVAAREADHRSDVFSFGAVLFEVLTGERAFKGANAVDVMHNIAHSEPQLEKVPPAFRRIVRRCLAKEPDERYQSMKDVALDLRETELDSPVSHRNPFLWPALAAVVAAVAIAAAFFTRSPKAAAVSRSNQQALAMQRITNSGNVAAAAISPDGRFAVYALIDGEQQSLWVRQLSTESATRISPPQPIVIQRIAVSPDNSYVYYAAHDVGNANVGTIYQLPILGGEPRRVAADSEFAFTISPDGKRLAFRRLNSAEQMSRLMVTDLESGSERVLLARKSPAVISSMAWTPDGSRITIVAGEINTFQRGLEDVSVADGKVSRIGDLPWQVGVSSLSWLRDGSAMLLSATEGEQPPQVWMLDHDGTRRQITSDVNAYYSVQASDDGTTIAAVRGEGTPSLTILRVGSDGTASVAASGLGNNFNASGMQPGTVVSSSYIATRGVAWLDATHLLYTGVVSGKPSALSLSTSGGEPRALTRGINAWSPFATPDGKTLIFVSDRSGSAQLWTSNVDGTNLRQLTHGVGVIAASASPDGRYVYFATAGSGQRTVRVPLQGGEPEPVIDVPSGSPSVSSDGKLLLCRYRTVTPNGTPLWRTAITTLDGKLVRFAKVPEHGGSQIRWGGSGKTIIAPQTANGVGNLWEENLETGAIRRITNFTHGVIYNIAPSPDGKSIALLQGDPRNDVVIIRNFR